MTNDPSRLPTNRLIMLTAAAGLLIVMLFIVGAGEQQRLVSAQSHYHAQRIENGAALYSLHCYNCHGIRGEGVGQLGPALNDQPFFTTRLKEVGWQSTLSAYTAATIEQGRMMGTRPIYAGNGTTAVMAPWDIRYGGPLRSDQIQELTDFILNWQETALGKVELVQLVLPEPNHEDPKVLEKGKHVFIHNCGRCHQFGESKPEIAGPDLSTLAVTGNSRIADMESEDYLRRSILVPQEFITPGFEKIAEKDSCGALLSSSELSALSSYLLH